MMKRDLERQIPCYQCGADNPITAYCCLACFKVLRPKMKAPFWEIHISTSPTAVLIIFLLFGVLVTSLIKWMQSIDAQVTITLSDVDKNLAMAEERRKKVSESPPSDINN
jgi:ribosomal protein L40E